MSNVMEEFSDFIKEDSLLLRFVSTKLREGKEYSINEIREMSNPENSEEVKNMFNNLFKQIIPEEDRKGIDIAYFDIIQEKLDYICGKIGIVLDNK